LLDQVRRGRGQVQSGAELGGLQVDPRQRVACC
jgi:hypothetical protein